MGIPGDNPPVVGSVVGEGAKVEGSEGLVCRDDRWRHGRSEVDGVHGGVPGVWVSTTPAKVSIDADIDGAIIGHWVIWLVWWMIHRKGLNGEEYCRGIRASVPIADGIGEAVRPRIRGEWSVIGVGGVIG